MAKLFGGRDPFDHPFFTQPFGSLFGGKNPFDDPFFTRPFDNQPASRKQITIEELDQDTDDVRDSKKNNMPSKEVVVKEPTENAFGSQSFSFQRVEYGGLDGMYYSSSVGRMTGPDGVALMEMKEEDKTVGESLHTISKGIYEKGHSVTKTHHSDGKVDEVQTLHNLNEDELTGFEENWKTNADKYLPGWSNGFKLLENKGSSVWDDFANWTGLGGWAPPYLEYYGNGRIAGPEGDTQGRGKSRKVVPVE